MANFFKGFDFFLPLSVLIIGALGLTLLWSLAPSLFPQQLLFFLVGFIFFFIFSQIDFRIYQNLRWLIYVGIITLLLLTFLLGEITRGSVRWIQIGQFTFQSSEIIKPFLLVFFAFFFSGSKFQFSKLLFAIFLFLIPVFIVFKQPDLGSALVLLSAFVGVLLALAIPLSFILASVGFWIIFLPLTWRLLAQYQKQRLLTFINPYLDPLGAGYNLIQAMISVGSGELFGRGLGRGTQSQLAFLPERHTDFIFASLSEELGFIGALVLLLLYFLLLWRILRITQNTKQDFAKIFGLGVFTMLLFQIFVNVGMNLGIVPIAGITLPFFSYGGSSILATMICLGMIENIARFQKSQKALEIR